MLCWKMKNSEYPLNSGEVEAVGLPDDDDDDDEGAPVAVVTPLNGQCMGSSMTGLNTVAGTADHTGERRGPIR